MKIGTKSVTNVKVRDLFTPKVLTAHPSEDLGLVSSRMQFHEVGALAVYEGHELVGIITERDVLRAVGEGRNTEVATVDEYMTPDPITIGANETGAAAAALMVTLGARHLPVTDKGAVVGMVSAKDVLSIEAWPELVEAAES